LPYNDLEKARDKENPEDIVKDLRVLNTKAADVIVKQREDIDRLRAEMSALKISQYKALSIGILAASYHKVPLGSFRDWVEGIGTIKDMGDIPAHFLNILEGVECDSLQPTK
jgi:hypothetical protein